MSNLLEWVQCKKCGRRHRWKAELAGSCIRCGCGTDVPVPTLDNESASEGTAGGTAAGSGAFDPDDTLVDPSLTNEAAAIADAPPKLGDDLELEGDSDGKSKRGKKKPAPAAISAVTTYGDTPMVVRGPNTLFGMSRVQLVVFWGSITALAFAAVVHAIIVQSWPYITAAVIMAPIALWKFIPAFRTWRGNRSFKRAWSETFASDSDPGSSKR